MQTEPSLSALTPTDPAANPRRHRWTAREVYRLVEKGFFRGKRIELIEGVIYEMAAQKNPHGISVSLTDAALRAAFGPTFWVRNQLTLDLSPFSLVDPDLAVIPGTPRDHAGASNPTSALLIVEVSDSTISYDRRTKGSLYARVGIADYWIVNLQRRRLEVRRQPLADSKARYGMSYGQRMIVMPGDTIAPLALPQTNIAVADLLA